MEFFINNVVMRSFLPTLIMIMQDIWRIGKGHRVSCFCQALELYLGLQRSNLSSHSLPLKLSSLLLPPVPVRLCG